MAESNRKLVLGIDIGGTKVAIGVGGTDGQGEILARYRRPTEAGDSAEADLARMADDAERLLAELGATPADLAAVGVSVPGPLDLARGLVIRPPNLPGWGEVPVRDLLAARLGARVFVENDANAAALAEWRHGAGVGLHHIAYLTMSTGVGGGLVLDGRIYRGRAGLAGEIGHVAVEWDGEPCACGLRGCLEAYVGGAAWTRRLSQTAPPDSLVTRLAAGPRVTPRHVVEAARAGDAFALAELDRFNHYLARAIATLAFSLAPEAVILGTIAAAAGEELCLAPVRERVRAHLWPAFANGMAIVPAALGDALPYLAGLCVAWAGLEHPAATKPAVEGVQSD